MRNASLGALVVILALPSGGCDDASSPTIPTMTAVPAVAQSAGTDTQRLRLVREFIRRRDPTVPDTALDALAGATLAVTAAEAQALDPADTTTWPQVSISRWEARAAIGRPGINHENWAYGQMHHNGQVGKIELTVTMRNAAGQIVQLFGPYSKTELNPYGRLVYDIMMYSHNMQPPAACGYKVDVRANFYAWDVDPLVGKLDPLNLPDRQLGLATRSSSGDATQPACPREEDDGGTGTGDTGSGSGTGGDEGATYSGETYAMELCYYRDWFLPDGTYLFTETVSCWVVYTSVNDQ